MKFTAPSGRVYEWDRPTPPTQADIDAMVRADAAAGPAQTDPATRARELAAQPQAYIGGGADAVFPPVTMDQLRAAKEMAVGAGIEGGAATVGQVAGGAIAGLPGAAVGGALLGAGGNAINQLRRGGPFSIGEMAGAAVSNALPGAPLAEAPAKAVIREGLRQGGMNVIANAVQTGIEKKRLPTIGEMAVPIVAAGVGTGMARGLDTGTNATVAAEALKRSQDSTRRATIEMGKELGYVLPPSVLRPNTGNNILNSVAGKAATAQEAIQRNQPITNQAIRDELGLLPSDSLSPQALNVARVGPNAVYAKAAAISPQSKIMLDNFKQAQADSNQLFQQYHDQFPKKPEVLAAAKQRQIDADDFMDMLDIEAKAHGKADLVDELKEARVKLAKIGLVDRALRKSNGNIDAKVIGDAFENGEKLDGNLLKIGRFQSAFSNAVKEASKTPPSGVNQLLPVMAGGAGAYGALAHGAQGLALAAPFIAAPRIAREIALSPYFQRRLQPTYGMTRQDIPAMLARNSAQAFGNNPYLQR